MKTPLLSALIFFSLFISRLQAQELTFGLSANTSKLTNTLDWENSSFGIGNTYELNFITPLIQDKVNLQIGTHMRSMANYLTFNDKEYTFRHSFYDFNLGLVYQLNDRFSVLGSLYLARRSGTIATNEGDRNKIFTVNSLNKYDMGFKTGLYYHLHERWRLNFAFSFSARNMLQNYPRYDQYGDVSEYVDGFKFIMFSTGFDFVFYKIKK